MLLSLPEHFRLRRQTVGKSSVVICETLGVSMYFTDSYSSRQCRSNKNAISFFHEFLQKEADFSKLSRSEFAQTLSWIRAHIKKMYQPKNCIRGLLGRGVALNLTNCLMYNSTHYPFVFFRTPPRISRVILSFQTIFFESCQRFSELSKAVRLVFRLNIDD